MSDPICWIGQGSDGVVSYRRWGSMAIVSMPEFAVPRAIIGENLVCESDDLIIIHRERSTADNSYSPIYSPDSAMSKLRFACMTDYNLGMTSDSKIGNYRFCTEGCVMAYDLEVQTDGVGLPLPNSTITCGTLLCSCGFIRCYTTMLHTGLIRAIRCGGSTALTTRMINDIATHMPVWLVGYNCYSFDNMFLAYNISRSGVRAHVDAVRLVSIKQRVGGSKGVVLQIPGVNNVDLMIYISTHHRSEYQRMSLNSVALELGLKGKTTHPSFKARLTREEADDMLLYNAQDCKCVIDICRETRYLLEACYLASHSRSWIIDVVRNNTGSYAWSIGKYVDWSVCTPHRGQFIGGELVYAGPGVYTNVASLDYNSMYPSIMMGANISPETISYAPSTTDNDGVVDWGPTHNYVGTLGESCMFDKSIKGIVPMMLEDLTSRRNVYKSTNPMMAKCVKISSNSIYGAQGFSMGPMYSPRCASSVTALGRWALTVLFIVCGIVGCTVVYGDTDSVHLSFTTATGVDRLLGYIINTTHTILRFTCCRTMSLGRVTNKSGGHLYRSMYVMKKKMYMLLEEDTTLTCKGVQIVRRDSIPIINSLCEDVARMIMLLPSNKQLLARSLKSRLVRTLRSVKVEMRLGDVAVVKRYMGEEMYEYRSGEGERVRVSIVPGVEERMVSVDVKHVVKAIHARFSNLVETSKVLKLSDVSRS